MKHRVKYSARLRAVSAALEQVEAPGDYCVTGLHAAFPLPGLVVDGVGDITFPLAETTAQALIAASHLAPFGHGEKTLVDTQVRNTWELSTSQFKLENPAFSAFVKDQIAEACRGPLGIHASVEFEPKLYKLLLYETGGKFERHQDSEKENGMFGTLVVVLPGRFEGGELVVQHPWAEKTGSAESKPAANSHVFDAGAMDPFSLKYAAFYGDCPHEVKPVTKGYRLCLTYNLVKVASPSTSIADPHYGSNHALYAALKDALEEFFCQDGVEKKKRQRIDSDGSSSPVGFDVTNVDSYRACKLVYVLTHKYTKANLSFDNLKNRDVAVAASLARFCDSSDGALGLYLCKMEYSFNWHGEEGTMYSSDDDSDEDKRSDDKKESAGNETVHEEDEEDEEEDSLNGDITRKIDLQYPWVQYGQLEAGPVCPTGEPGTFAEGDLPEEVTPCGFFQKKGFRFDFENSSEYTGNDGANSDRWYGSAALVVAPLQLVAQWSVRCKEDPTKLLQKWSQVAVTKPAHARVIARALQGCTFNFSTTSPVGVRILEEVAKIDDIDLVCIVLGGFTRVEFQPKLHDIVCRFDVLKAVKKILSYHEHSRGYYTPHQTVNFVASLLDGVHDPAIVAEALDGVAIVPHVGSDDLEDASLQDNDTTPEDFARVLKLASLVSFDRVKTFLDASPTKAMVLVVAPAVKLLFEDTKDQPVFSAVALAIANHTLDLLKQKAPALRDASYTWSVGCQSGYYHYGVQSRCACGKLRKFLKSSGEVALFGKKAFDSHLKGKLEEVRRLDRFSVEPSSDGDESKVVLKKTYEGPLMKQAQQEIATLSELTVEFVRVAVVSGGRATDGEE